MRKKILVSLFLVFSFHLNAMPVAKAETCKSAGQIFGDVYKKWGIEMVAAGCITAEALTTGGLTLPLTLQCIKKVEKYAKATEEMVKFFNVMANNSWATIGPRRIEFGNNQTGTLVSTLSRVFISPAPVDTDSVTFKVKKLDGKAKVTVVICKVDHKGNATKLTEFEFDKGEDNTGQEVSRRVSGVQGYIIQVRLDADSVAKEFKYNLRVTK
jgi:hypothetical protein